MKVLGWVVECPKAGDDEESVEPFTPVAGQLRAYFHILSPGIVWMRELECGPSMVGDREMESRVCR